jgi:SAM-dependent methyltransferase
MPDVWGYLTVKYQVKSLLDLGCGFGHTMRWFGEMLVGVRGVEGWEEAIRGHLTPGLVTQHDYRAGPAPLGDQTYDLCWSAEFVEHVDEEFIPNYVADMKRASIIVLTHGEPGQNGHHHVTLKDDQWWVEKLGSFGLIHDPAETALLRLTDRWGAGWGRRTLMLFRNPERATLPAPVFTKLKPIYET